MFQNCNSLLVAFLACAILFTACEEVGPDVNFTPKSELVLTPDTTYAKQERKVLLEEFTGVLCPNCPDGTEKVKELTNIHGDRILPIAMHAGALAGFIEGKSIQNLMTDEGSQLHIDFGNSGQPAAVIDRVQYPSEFDLFTYSRAQWEIYVNERLEMPSECNIHINPNFNAANDSLGIEIRIEYTESFSDDHYVTVGILENHIIEPQKQPDESIIDDYEHNHILRKMISGYQGDILIGQGVQKSPGLTVIRNFGLSNIPEVWNREHLEIYAFVHRRGDVKDVLQSALVEWPQ